MPRKGQNANTKRKTGSVADTAPKAPEERPTGLPVKGTVLFAWSFFLLF